MSDFAASWELSRKRFVDAVEGLSQEQLNWRLHADSLTIGEMAIHVAGVEVYFISQLLGTGLNDFEKRLSRAATEGVVNDNSFPFATEEITPALTQAALETGEALTRPVITAVADEIRGQKITSALGPVIDGTGALARLAFHPGYHQGQAYLIKTAPGFPE